VETLSALVVGSVRVRTSEGDQHRNVVNLFFRRDLAGCLGL
jgi:hypothetical protein